MPGAPYPDNNKNIYLVLAGDVSAQDDELQLQRALRLSRQDNHAAGAPACNGRLGLRLFSRAVGKQWPESRRDYLRTAGHARRAEFGNDDDPRHVAAAAPHNPGFQTVIFQGVSRGESATDVHGRCHTGRSVTVQWWAAPPPLISTRLAARRRRGPGACACGIAFGGGGQRPPRATESSSTCWESGTLVCDGAWGQACP